MNGMNDELRRAAVAIVAMHQPCSPYTLLDALKREYGASTAAANTTMLTLIRDGQLRRTFDGKLILPGGGGGGGMSMARVIVLAVFLLVIVAFMAWVFYNMAQSA
jgi:hypothetical protein